MDYVHYNFQCGEAYYKFYVDAINDAIYNRTEFSLAISQAAFSFNVFACELYFKCILSIEGFVMPKGKGIHELKPLFDYLSQSTRDRITEIYNSVSDNLKERKLSGDSTDCSIESVLSEAESAYNRFRYSFQPNTRKTQSYHYRVSSVLSAVRTYIKEIKPEWNLIVELS